MQIGIINYRTGNLCSVRNALDAVGIVSIIESNPKKIFDYNKLILPGVGAFGDAIKNLEETGMLQALLDFIKSGRYVLGICLGMQLLLEKSNEFGEHKGLGLIKGEVARFKIDDFKLHVPHVGWNQCLLSPNGMQHDLLKDIPPKTHLYFVHSYHAICADKRDVLAICNYGYSFPAIIGRENVLGIQPHPEKSQDMGLKILKNFTNL